MRLWSLHPRYLDSKGLVALWREALLAQKVLAGQTQGYTRHPQLQRFRRHRNPAGAIASYLRHVHAEALRRGYRFDKSKIGPSFTRSGLTVTRGQLEYELQHLRAKLKLRDPARLQSLGDLVIPQPHPLFDVVDGAIAEWEIR